MLVVIHVSQFDIVIEYTNMSLLQQLLGYYKYLATFLSFNPSYITEIFTKVFIILPLE